MNKREVEQAIRDEVADWEGVSVEFEHGGKHPLARLEFGGLIMRRAFGGNQDRTPFPHKTIADMRRVMIQMGATRNSAEPTQEETEKRYRKPNEEGVRQRPGPVAREPIEPEPSLAEKLVAAGAAPDPDPVKVDPVPERPPGTLFERMAALQRSDDSLARQRQLSCDEDEAEPEEAAERRRERVREVREAARQIEDGIYFGLPDEIYHAIEALGSGSLVKLNISPGTFWKGSWLNPKNDEQEELDEDATKAMIIGRAYHVAFLEPERWPTAYRRDLAKADFPECRVWNGTQVGKALKQLSETQKRQGESVADQAQRLEDAGYDRPIWPLLQARHKAEVAKLDPLPVVIPADAFDEIEQAVEWALASPEVAELLADGFAEVSVIWTDAHGTRCKSRFDKLSWQRWLDLKTFANPQSKPLEKLIPDSIRYGGMYVQAAHYRDAIEAIREGKVEVRGEASDDQRQMIERLRLAPELPACWYVFQAKGGIPDLIAERFPFMACDFYESYEIDALLHEGTEAERQMVKDARATPTGLFRKGQFDVKRAKGTYRHYSTVYRRGRPWGPVQPIRMLRDEEFNHFWLEER